MHVIACITIMDRVGVQLSREEFQTLETEVHTLKAVNDGSSITEVSFISSLVRGFDESRDNWNGYEKTLSSLRDNLDSVEATEQALQ